MPFDPQNGILFINNKKRKACNKTLSLFDIKTYKYPNYKNVLIEKECCHNLWSNYPTFSLSALILVNKTNKLLKFGKEFNNEYTYNPDYWDTPYCATFKEFNEFYLLVMPIRVSNKDGERRTISYN